LRPFGSSFSVALKGRIGVSAFKGMDRLPSKRAGRMTRIGSPPEEQLQRLARSQSISSTARRPLPLPPELPW
jgi:hypothetical protein